MGPDGAYSTTDEGDVREMPELEMAARVADEAAEEPCQADGGAPDERRTLARAADSDYQQAIDDIAFLVAMRREVSHSVLLDDGGDLEPDVEDAIGAWGPFELIERLGGGASGEVYKVRDRHLDTYVALKLFHEKRVASVELDTLLVEGRQHALVKHPNIAVIHGADENDGRVGIWMEFLDGATLQELVETQGTFGAAEVVIIARELCSALAAVHQQELTHGDIKAQNVMREKGGRIVLMDFSSSRSVELEDESPGGLVGTPIYMAPELFDDKPSDFRSDIYALGVLLFYLVTGRHPYEARSLKGLKEAVRTRRPLLLDDLRPDLPSGFIRAVGKATAKAPEDRFQSAGEFQSALRDAIPAEPSESLAAPMVEPAPDLGPLVRAARVVTASVLVTSFLALLGFANEFQFDVVLHVPDHFSNYSVVNALVVGLRSLVMSIGLVVVELVPLALVWSLIAAFTPGAARAIRQFGSRVAGTLRKTDFNRLATAFTLICVLSFAFAFTWFGSLLSLLVTMAESSSARGIDVSILTDSDYHVRFTLLLTQVAMVMTLGWLVLFHGLKPSGALALTARFMRGLSAAVIVASLVIMASPWRLLWKNESLPVWIGTTKGYVVAERDDEWFVYLPRAAGTEQRLVIHRDDPRITRVGEKPESIFID